MTWRALAEAGPLFVPLAESGVVDWQAWERASRELEARLPASDSRARRIHHLYVPCFLWLLRQRAPGRCTTLGISAPQGAGKTTFVREAVHLFASLGAHAVSVSMDDFYLTHEEQLRVAARHRGNRILEHRGAPGTHDLSLGEETLSRLPRLSPGETMRVPSYDKTAHAGRGDRAPVEKWPEVRGPVDMVLFEGWSFAFQPKGADNVEPDLGPVDQALAGYACWQRHLSGLLSWRALDLEQIVAWRVEAEERSRAAGRPGLSREEAEDYIRRFMPVYRAYADGVTKEGPWGEALFDVTLGPDRLPAA